MDFGTGRGGAFFQGLFVFDFAELSYVGGVHARSLPPLDVAHERPPGRAALRSRANAAVFLEHQAETVLDGIYPLRHGGFDLGWKGCTDRCRNEKAGMGDEAGAWEHRDNDDKNNNGLTSPHFLSRHNLARSHQEQSERRPVGKKHTHEMTTHIHVGTPSTHVSIQM